MYHRQPLELDDNDQARPPILVVDGTHQLGSAIARIHRGAARSSAAVTVIGISCTTVSSANVSNVSFVNVVQVVAVHVPERYLLAVPRTRRPDIATWPGGRLRVVRVFEFPLGIQGRSSQDAGEFDAEPFGDGLALLTHVEPVCDADDDVVAEIEIGVVNGQPGVRSIRASGSALTSTLLRERVPALAQLVREVARARTVRLAVPEEGELVGERALGTPMDAIRDADGAIIGFRGVADVESAESLGPLRDALDADLDQTLATRKPRTIDDAFLQKVAAVYRVAVAAGVSTQRAIQDELGPVSDAGARRWVQKARQGGHLGRSLGAWRAGEQ